MDINRQNMSALYVSFLAAFQRGLYSDAPTSWQRVATLFPSDTDRNVYPFLGQWPGLREWIGERVIKSLEASKYELKNKTYESTIEVEKDAVLDDRWGIYGPMFTAAGEAARFWPDEVVFGVLRAGKTELCYDGKPFFATDHPHKVDGAVSNLDEGDKTPWYLLDVGRTLKPLIWQVRQEPKMVRLDREEDENVFKYRKYIYGIDARGAAGYSFWQLAHRSELTLDETNLSNAIASMKSRTNDEGRDLRIGRQLLLVVPPSLEVQARKLVSATTAANGATNVLAGAAEVFVTNLVAE